MLVTSRRVYSLNYIETEENGSADLAAALVAGPGEHRQTAVQNQPPSA
ncbi:hypothetical protein N836_05140 [Leptolyngbya sp. Heron Island J]|nr:hypothetical protein N836_05140 [Leptolyngbya sp. Heron Island J]